MQLTYAQIASFTRGCGRVVEEDDHTRFDRLGPAARAYYDRQPAWALRARCPAGVVLDLVTDAAAVDLHLALDGGARKHAAAEAVLDGILVAGIRSALLTEPVRGRLALPPCATPRRVQLYLPHCAAATVAEVDLVGATVAQPAAREPVLLALGDSITQGMDSPHPALTYAAVAARLTEHELYNGGVGGAVFAEESLPEPPVATPALITVAFGTNDFAAGLSPDLARPYLRQVQVHYPGVPLAVLAPLWRAKGDGDGSVNPAGLTMPAYRDALRRIATAAGATWIAHDWLLPPGPDWLVDGTHPSAAGHLVMGQNLARRLRPLHAAHTDHVA